MGAIFHHVYLHTQRMAGAGFTFILMAFLYVTADANEASCFLQKYRVLDVVINMKKTS